MQSSRWVQGRAAGGWGLALDLETVRRQPLMLTIPTLHFSPTCTPKRAHFPRLSHLPVLSPQDPCLTLVLRDVICPSCQDCQDLDMCRDPAVGTLG